MISHPYDTRSRGLAWYRESLAEERRELGLAFNPFGTTFKDRSDAVYRELRERSPVHFSRLLDCWLVTRYADVEAALRASDVFRSDPSQSSQELIDPFALLDPDNPSLFMLDPPDHRRLRGVIQGAFARGSIDNARDRLEQSVGRVVRDLGKPGAEAELVASFAQLVPLHAIDAITGLETEATATFSNWVVTIAAAMEPVATAQSATEALDCYRALKTHLAERWRGTFPPASLGAALKVAVDQGVLGDREALQLLVFVVLAGTKTVSDFLANAARHLVALPTHSPERSNVGVERIDELLRVFSPVQLVARTAARSTELGGRQIHRGQRVLLVLASANQDDSSDACSSRETTTSQALRDVTFGRGIHTCVGWYLARMEAQMALSLLLGTYPEIRLCEATPSRRGIVFRSWDRIQVVL